MNNQIRKSLEKFKQLLMDRFGSQLSLILFGSVAREDAQAISDVDVLVLVPEKVTHSIEEEIFDVAYDIELTYDLVLGVIVYSKESWGYPRMKAMPLYQNIEREGIAI